MRILIANKDLLTTKAIASYLSNFGYEVEVATSLNQIPELINYFNPEIVMLGYLLNPNGFMDWIRDLKQKIPAHCKQFVIFVPDISSFSLNSVRDLGIAGLIHYDDDISTLNNCIIQILNNDYYLSPKLRVKEQRSQASYPSLSILTKTEREIALRIANGESTKEIATNLFRSIETIQNHRKSIKDKLQIRGGKSTLLEFLKNN
jgi:DNA-binding NarL/FixJ family response regulator